jgi:HD-GYP domain-containing protein (c-di-GMP phosphodiesterase class II)
MEYLNKSNEPLYGSRGINAYIQLIKRDYAYININELLDYANMFPYEIEDEGHMFTQKQINRFYERLVFLSGNKNIAREAGRYAASPESLGSLRRYILGLIGPFNAYELIGKYANKISMSSLYESKIIGKNKVEITVTPRKGIEEEPFQCENRLGYWDAISTAFNYKFPKIEHPECIFQGGSSCRYIVSWQESRYIYWKKIRNFMGVLLLLICLVSPYIISNFITLTTVLPLSIAVFSFLGWYTSLINEQELNRAVEILRDSSDELVEQINVNYENTLLINELSKALSKELELSNILSNVTEVLKKRLDYDRGLILLANKNKTRLNSKTGFGYRAGELNKFLPKEGFHLDRVESKGIFVNCFKSQKPFLINNIDEIKDNLSSRSLDFAIKMGVKSFICCPIIYEDESIGILAVDNLRTKKPLVQRDINILMGVANQIAISIHNASLIDARFRQFQSILHVLSATTDARDPITAGHSERVTELAVGICNELNLSYNYTEMIRVASLLHDYGKIGVDDAILKKPGRLDDNEYEHIKTHALKTKNILKQINFEGIYKEVPEIAGAHHEKLDGSGYPNNLTGDKIHFGAKIIAVADVFEALTSQRHYRDPMPVNEAFDYLVNKIGVHFEKDCVEALIRLYNTSANVPYNY